jgi:hypothetical protein
MNNDTQPTPVETPTTAPLETTSTPEPTPAPTPVPTPTPQPQKSSFNPAVIVIGIIVLAIAGGILFAITSPGQGPTNRTIGDKGTPLKENHVAEMATAVCRDEPYTTIFQHPENEKTIIMRCDRRNPEKIIGIEEYNVYYSITDKDDKNSGYYKTGRFTYLGEDNVESAEKYLKGYKYIYMRGSAPILILLVEANSETEAVNKVAGNVYDFITRDLAEHPSWELDFRTSIYYAKDLSSIEDIKDYIVLTAPYVFHCDYNGEDSASMQSPEGNGFGSYSFNCETEVPPTLQYLSNHTELQKEAVKTALSNRHAEYEFRKVSYKEKYDTKEEFRTNLINSFVNNE